jgi:hypothetical protein
MGIPQREARRPKRYTGPKAPVDIRVPSKNWVEEKDRGTNWYLFHELYHVRIPYLQMLSIEELKHFGMPTTGDPEYDKQVARENRDVMLSIQRCAELYDSGAVIGVVNFKDTRRIYERISNHLESWASHIRGNMNKVKVPVKDLLLLDRFAHSIYEFAKYDFAEDGFIASLITEMAGHQLTRGLDLLQSKLLQPSPLTPVTAKPAEVPILNYKPLLPPAPVVDEEEQKPGDNLPKRQSMADFFMPTSTAATAADAMKVANGTSGPSVSPSVAALLGSLKGKDV